MESIRIIAEPVWSWPLVVLTGVVLIAVVLITYPPRVRHLAPRWRKTLIGMRLASAVLLIFALLRPAVQFIEIDPSAAVLVVLMDKSRSMTTPDGVGGATRREMLAKTLADSQILGEELLEGEVLGEHLVVHAVGDAEAAAPQHPRDHVLLDLCADPQHRRVLIVHSRPSPEPANRCKSG